MNPEILKKATGAVVESLSKEFWAPLKFEMVLFSASDGECVLFYFKDYHIPLAHVAIEEGYSTLINANPLFLAIMGENENAIHNHAQRFWEEKHKEAQANRKKVMEE